MTWLTFELIDLDFKILYHGLYLLYLVMILRCHKIEEHCLILFILILIDIHYLSISIHELIISTFN